MLLTNSVVGEVASKLRTIVVHAPLMRMACLAALGVALALSKAGLGDETEQPDKSKSSTSSASERTPDLDQRTREKNDRSGSDDSVRHHGALGVLLSKSEDGVTIVGVIPGSPAERAGLRLGDEIRYVDDQRIRITQELIDAIGADKPGTRVELMIRRNGKRQIVEANLASRESTFNNRDRPTSSESGRRGGSTARGDQQADRVRGPNNFSSGLKGGQVRDPQQQLNQRIAALERQIYHLNQELNELRYSQSVHAQEGIDLQSWWERQHHGDNDGDQSLFQ